MKSPVFTVVVCVETDPLFEFEPVLELAAVDAVDASEYPVHVIVVPFAAASPSPSLIDFCPPSAYV